MFPHAENDIHAAIWTAETARDDSHEAWVKWLRQVETILGVPSPYGSKCRGLEEDVVFTDRCNYDQAYNSWVAGETPEQFVQWTKEAE